MAEHELGLKLHSISRDTAREIRQRRGQSNTTRAARAAQGCTDDSVRMGAGVCANDEVAKDRRTGITRAYTQDMLSRERTMDDGLHNALPTRRLHNLLGAGHDLEAR